jgi:broad specificity phosphatase PhoE
MLKNRMTTIYIVRHGQSKSNLEEIMAGHTDTHLTPDGEKQAEERAKNLNGITFDAVFSSDLIRAKRTAEIIAAEHQLAVNTTHLLRERNFGEWEGKAVKDFYEKNVQLFEKLKILSETDKQHFRLGNGYENNAEIATRLTTFLREIAATYFGKTILIVCHGSIMRSLLMRLGFGSYDELPAGCIENTGYFILESDGVDFFVKETVGIHKATI